MFYTQGHGKRICTESWLRERSLAAAPGNWTQCLYWSDTLPTELSCPLTDYCSDSKSDNVLCVSSNTVSDCSAKKRLWFVTMSNDFFVFVCRIMFACFNVFLNPIKLTYYNRAMMYWLCHIMNDTGLLVCILMKYLLICLFHYDYAVGSTIIK